MRAVIVSSLVLLAAGCGPRSTAGWLRQLEEGDVVKRRQAIRELAGRTGDSAKVVPVLVKALADESPYIRRDAAVALGKFSSEAKETAPHLVEALADKDRSVRTAAAASLKKIDPDTATRVGVK